MAEGPRSRVRRPTSAKVPITRQERERWSAVERGEYIEPALVYERLRAAILEEYAALREEGATRPSIELRIGLTVAQIETVRDSPRLTTWAYRALRAALNTTLCDEKAGVSRAQEAQFYG
jgi:hypothetical protein